MGKKYGYATVADVQGLSGKLELTADVEKCTEAARLAGRFSPIDVERTADGAGGLEDGSHCISVLRVLFNIRMLSSSPNPDNDNVYDVL